MYDYDDYISNVSVEDLEHSILHRTIVEVDEERNEILLDNGEVLRLFDTDECSSWFAVNLRAGNLVDNAITAIKKKYTPQHIPEDNEDNNFESYDIHILAGNKKVVALEIEGTEGNGYYFHSFSMSVKY